MYKYAYIYEMNDINDTRDRKEELGLFVIVKYSHCL